MNKVMNIHFYFIFYFSRFIILSKAMWRMLQHENPEDYVIATGEVHSVREFTERSFAHVGIKIV